MTTERSGYDTAARRWTKRPRLAACPHQAREWQIDASGPTDDDGKPVPERQAMGRVGTNYQNQLHCRRWQRFVNPSGVTCELCGRGEWPDHVRVGRAVMNQVTAGRADDARAYLAECHKRGQVSYFHAAEIAFVAGLAALPAALSTAPGAAERLARLRAQYERPEGPVRG
jgi:hypothetical protein